MTVTATEVKTNFGKYLELAKTQEIYITKNGTVVAVLTNPTYRAVDNLAGLLENELPPDFTTKDLKEEKYKDFETNV